MFWRIFTESLALIVAIVALGDWISRIAGRYFGKDHN